MSGRPRSSVLLGLATLIASALVAPATYAITRGEQALDFFANSDAGPSFGQRYGANPTRYNGGRSRHCAAQDKRAARKRANLRKHPRCANGARKSP